MTESGKENASANAVRRLLAEYGFENADASVVDVLLRIGVRDANDLLKRIVHFGRTIKGVEPSALTVDDVFFMNRIKALKNMSDTDEDEWSHLVEERNSIALSLQGNKKAIALPPERHCLLMPNYRLVNCAPFDRRTGAGKVSKRLNLSSGFTVYRAVSRPSLPSDAKKGQIDKPTVPNPRLSGPSYISMNNPSGRYVTTTTTTTADKRTQSSSVFRMVINSDQRNNTSSSLSAPTKQSSNK